MNEHSKQKLTSNEQQAKSFTSGILKCGKKQIQI